MFEKWISVSTAQLAMILLTSIIVYAAILIYTRIAGLRSFSKMSAADFAMTIAVGSLFGATVSAPNPTLLAGLFALLCLFAAQWGLAYARRKSNMVSKLVDNEPLLLMNHGEIIEENLELANMTESDLFGKLREANALNFTQVKAVVFETTGDVSVLHSSSDDVALEERIFEGVVGAERLFTDR